MEPYLALNIAEVLQMSLDDVGIEDWGIFSASFRFVRLVSVLLLLLQALLECTACALVNLVVKSYLMV